MHTKTYGYAHAEEIDPPIPIHPNTPVEQEKVDRFKAMGKEELLLHCENLLTRQKHSICKF